MATTAVVLDSDLFAGCNYLFSNNFLSFSNDQSNSKVTNMKQFVNVVVLSDHGQIEL